MDGGLRATRRGCYGPPVLLLLPPSETKRPAADDGPVLDLAGLAFPALTPSRETALEALVTTSAGDDAARRLHAPLSRVDEVRRNLAVRDLPTAPAAEVYDGPLFQAMDAESWSAGTAERAATRVVITSPIFGALRPADRMPAYRCHPCADLDGIGPVEQWWRPRLGPVLDDAARDHALVLELRSSAVRALGVPASASDRTVVVRVLARPGDRRAVGGFIAKATIGWLARIVLERDGPDPEEPAALIDILCDLATVSLEAPAGAGRPWSLTMVAPAS